MVKIIRPDGLIGINLIGLYPGEKSKPGQSINQTLKIAYKDTDVYATSPDPVGIMNIIFFASNKP
ncbi:MAG: hypothetical protein ACREOW_04375, partial [Thermodesulfobacteriota bacterium]